MNANKSGFTLIELVIVVAIIALLVSIFIPSCNEVLEQEEQVQEEVQDQVQDLHRCFITISEKTKHKDQLFVVDTERTTWLCVGSNETTDLELYGKLVEGKKYYIAYYRIPDQTMHHVVKASEEN